MPIISFLRVRRDRNPLEFHEWLLAQINATFKDRPARTVFSASKRPCQPAFSCRQQ